MQKRKLRIIKPPLPAIGICERCNARFKSSNPSQTDANEEIKIAFDAHSCLLTDSSQNALQIVRESTENK